MTFAILGPLEVRRDGEVVEIAGQRLRTLLGLLVVEAGRTVPLATLIAGVWADRPPDGVANALQALVSRLRAALGKNPVRQLIVAEPAGYRLVAGPDQVDAHRFAVLAGEGQARLAEGDAATAAGLLREALALWRGPALADLADLDVVAAYIARLDHLRLAAAEDRIEADLRLGRPADALDGLAGLLAVHPLRERLHGLRMRALHGAGRRVEALAAYESARRAFRDTLGADPSPELARIHLNLLRDEPVVRTEDSRERRAGNLRARLTSFVGRDRDVAHIGDLLGRHRLVTVLGPGGAGKTRLAVEAAAALAPPGGAWLVELAGAADVAQAVSAALELRDGTRVPGPELPIERLVRLIGDREPLIVLDNCEHVIDDAAELAERVLADCPGVRVLATSREPLAVTGEVSWVVPPLELPPPGAGDPREYAAVRLFADRAAAVRPGYAPDAAEAAAVARICRALDGLPLAIELAAARMRSLGAGEVAARLGDRFSLLTSGSRTAQPRHQTLRAVVSWSWDLLPGPERELAARMSVFAGGATLEAVEQVCAADLEPLTRLVDKSLVVFESGRYRMLETIRAFAAEHLTGGDRIRRAHAAYHLRFAEEAEPGLRAAGQLRNLAALTAEHDNLDAALRWCVTAAAADPEAGEMALRLVGALGWYWWLRGSRLEGAQRSAEALAAAPAAPAHLRALGLAVHGINAVGAALPWEEARAALAQARRLGGPGHPLVALAMPMFILYGGAQRLSRETGDPLAGDLLNHTDPWVVASGHLTTGLLSYYSGRIGGCEADLRAALAGYRAVGDRWGISSALAAVADLHVLRGEIRQGIEVMGEALEVMRTLGAVEDIPYLRARLAIALNLAGDRARAERHLAEIADLVVRFGDRVGEAGVTAAQGDLARHDGDLATALACYGRAMAIMESSDGVPKPMIAAVNTSLALIALDKGRQPDARRHLTLALEQAATSGDAQLTGLAVVGCAAHALAVGDATRAAVLLGAAAAVKGLTTVVDPDHARITHDTRSALPAGSFDVHFAQGQTLDRPAALALAGSFTRGS
ncbi:BTAD domain-containing putative transcriptional regulator [Nonomuraea sp. NPDC050394]|uniref:BTAD domain-containing putative transcriptional regulator n=1 Tax=Nonomuraea sp. NPDC050394 TaxID=3364363 RepID=UPI003799B77D